MRPLYVQFGCGTHAPPEWLNFDASPRLLLERIFFTGTVISISSGRLFPRNVRFGNIVDGLPLSAKSCAGVYSSHVLEHISREDVPRALQNAARLLRSGGIFRLVVPDLSSRMSRYLEADEQRFAAADEFMDSCLLGKRRRVFGLPGFLREYLGNSNHLWMYDYKLLEHLLKAAGFVDVRRCSFGDSFDPMFALVEQRDRFFDGEHVELAIEAKSP